MGNGVSTDQGNLPTHGKRDVRQAADSEQHDWSELAEAPKTNTSLLSDRNSYISGQLRGLETLSSVEDSTRSDAYNGARTRGQKSSLHATDDDTQYVGPRSSIMEDDNERVDASLSSARLSA